jgi:hypothetical protein
MSRQIPFDECLAQLDALCGGELLDGAAPDAILAVRQRNEEAGPYAEALRMVVDWIPVRSADQAIARNDFIHALGPLRLRHQSGEGSAETYRALARLIRAIDAVYDELDSDTAHGSACH